MFIATFILDDFSTSFVNLLPCLRLNIIGRGFEENKVEKLGAEWAGIFLFLSSNVAEKATKKSWTLNFYDC